MKKSIFSALCLVLLATTTQSAWGAEVTETATFNSKSWGIADGSNFSWTSGKDGNGFTNNQGVQITTGVSGANATTSKSFTNISKIEVTYCTNSKAGKGTITLQVGTGTEQSFSVSAPSKGGTTRKTTTFNYATPESGAVKLTVVCTTNSIYIYSITVTYESGSTGTTPLVAPQNLSVSNVTSTTVDLSWDAVTNATRYIVTYIDENDVMNTKEVNGTTTTLAGLSANTCYVWTVKAVGDGTNYSDSPESNTSNFTTTELAKYTITWMSNNTQYGQTQEVTEGSTATPPGTPSVPGSCSDKVFVGWGTTNIGTTPTNDPGDLFTTEFPAITADATYYAVFATAATNGGGSGEAQLSQTLQYDTLTYSGSTTDKKDYRLFPSGSYIESAEFDLSTLSKVVVYGGTFGGDSYNKLTIGDGTNTWKDVTVSGSSQTGVNTYTNGTSLSGTGKLRITSKSGTASSNGVRISKVQIYTVGTTTYSDYVTQCCTTTNTVSLTIAQDTINLNSESKATTTITAGYSGNAGGEFKVTSNGTELKVTNGTPYTFEATTKGQYVIEVTYDEGGCPVSVKDTITVLAKPTITLVAYDPPADPIVFEDPKCGGNTPLTSKKSVKLQGYNLTDSVTVTVIGDYKIARIATAALGDYTTSLTLDKTNEGKINANYQTIYILSTPPAAKTDATKGTLIITTKGGNTLTVNLSTPTITCAEYTLTFRDRGGTHQTVTQYAGTEVAEPTAPTGVCTDPIHYVFDGWAEATVSEDSPSYTKVTFPYTMPKNNTTELYAVYKYVSAVSDEYKQITTDSEIISGADYLIVGRNSANGTTHKAFSTEASSTTGQYTAVAVSPTSSVITNTNTKLIWRIDVNGTNYTLYNAAANKYANINNDVLSLAETATPYTLSVSSSVFSFKTTNGSSTNKAYLSYYNNGSIFNAYSSTNTINVYKRQDSYAYTSDPACGPHIGLMGDVRITSAKDVRVDAYTKITVSGTNLNKNTGGNGGTATAVSIKAESDNANFKIKRWGTTGDGTANSLSLKTNITDANYEDSLCITYTPTASNTTESATITLTAYKYNGSTPYATKTITVLGHSLPERFVIAAKGTDGWVALPNTLGSNSSATVPNAENINDVVDNTTSPTKLTNAPSTVIYTAAARGDSYKNNSPTGLRFTKDGGQFLQGELSGPKVWLSTTGSQDMQSWTLRTEDFADYEVRLDSDMVKGRYLAYNKDATTERIGHYATYTAIRFLPFEAECTRLLAPINLKVTQVKSSAITLTWDAVTGATGYAYSTDGTTWTEMGNVLTYTITGLTAEKAYTIWVKGVVPAGDTDCSYYGTVSATTTNCDDVPYDISYTSDVNSITLSWKMTSATATVRLYSDDAGKTQVGSDYTGVTSPCTIPNLDKATTYYARILADGTCPSKLIEVSTERPQLDVVEWYENKIDVEINTDEKISVLLENQVTKGTGSGKVAEDLFFSKYFEATGTLKLIGIYNGTNTDVDVSNLKIRIGAAGTYNMRAGCTKQEKKDDNPLDNNIVDVSTLGIPNNKIPMGTEIIIYTMGNATTTMVDASTKTSACIENTLNDYFGDSTGVKRDNWYSSTNCVWAGRQTIALYNGNDMIDVIGAYWKDGTTIKADGTHIRCYNEVSTYFSDPTASYSGDDPGWFARGKNYLTDEEIILSTNRCLLIRSNSVTSGADAVEQNRTPTYTKGGNFTTLSTEWKGLPVGGSQSSDYASNKLVCDNFSAVAQFDYSGYYTTYDSLMVKTFDENGRNPDGTITIEIPLLDTLSCRGLKIIASDTSGHVLTTKEYRVPIIVSKSTTTADAKVFHFSKDTCETCDVVVRPNIKLQAKAESDGGKVQFRNMMVYAKGNFEIPTGVDFTLDNLEMHAKNDTVAYALIDGSLTVTNKITHVKRINSVTMGGAGYHFALPYPCDGTSIRQYNGNSLGEYDVDWVVFYYDGAARAETGTWNEAGTGYNGKSYWRTFPTADFELQPNVAYIIATAGINAGNSLKSVYFPPKASKGYSETIYTESTPDSKTVAVKAYTGTAAKLHANDRGWNFIGHPYISMFNHQTTGATGTNNDQVQMGYWTGTEYSEDTKVYVNVPQNGVTSYKQDEAANLKMSPFLGYFVQVAGDADAELTFIKGARELSAAPMMRAASVRDEHAEVALKLTAPSGEFDRTTILVDEAYTVDYEINRDLGKMARAKGLPRFYSISMEGLNEKMCYQALPSAVAENNVPLGFYAYEAGTYTIAIDSTRGDLSAVTAVALKVDGNVVHDLLSGPYTFAVSKARSTDNDSFSVSIQRKAQVTTDVNVVGNSDAVAPVVYTQGHRIHIQQLPLTGRLHIIDAVGRTIVDEQLDGCSERQYTLATDGVYVVRVATDSNVFIVKVAIR